jgi:hypothetical protein
MALPSSCILPLRPWSLGCTPDNILSFSVKFSFSFSKSRIFFPLEYVSWDTPAILASSSLVSIGFADFCGTAPPESLLFLSAIFLNTGLYFSAIAILCIGVKFLLPS